MEVSLFYCAPNHLANNNLLVFLLFSSKKYVFLSDYHIIPQNL